MRKYLGAVLVLFVSFLCISYSSAFAQTQEEQLTITTYYPSPFGSYNTLRARWIFNGEKTDHTMIDWSGNPPNPPAQEDWPFLQIGGVYEKNTTATGSPNYFVKHAEDVSLYVQTKTKETGEGNPIGIFVRAPDATAIYAETTGWYDYDVPTVGEDPDNTPNPKYRKLLGTIIGKTTTPPGWITELHDPAGYLGAKRNDTIATDGFGVLGMLEDYYNESAYSIFQIPYHLYGGLAQVGEMNLGVIFPSMGTYKFHTGVVGSANRNAICGNPPPPGSHCMATAAYLEGNVVNIGVGSGGQSPLSWFGIGLDRDNVHQAVFMKNTLPNAERDSCAASGGCTIAALLGAQTGTNTLGAINLNWAGLGIVRIDKNGTVQRAIGAFSLVQSDSGRKNLSAEFAGGAGARAYVTYDRASPSMQAFTAAMAGQSYSYLVNAWDGIENDAYGYLGRSYVVSSKRTRIGVEGSLNINGPNLSDAPVDYAGGATRGLLGYEVPDPIVDFNSVDSTVLRNGKYGVFGRGEALAANMYAAGFLGNVAIDGNVTVASGNPARVVIVGDNWNKADPKRCNLHVRGETWTWVLKADELGVPFPSSEKYKKDIHKFDQQRYDSFLKKINETDLYEYRYKTDSSDSRIRFGLIIEHAPEEAITQDREAVNMAGLVNLLVGAVKAQQSEIEELKKEIAALKK